MSSRPEPFRLPDLGPEVTLRERGDCLFAADEIPLMVPARRPRRLPAPAATRTVLTGACAFTWLTAAVELVLAVR